MPPLPDITHSYIPTAHNKMEVDDVLPPSIPSPVRPFDRTTSGNAEISDDTFVDQLFTAFKTENFDFDDSDLSMSSMHQPKITPRNNRPRPELMSRLSDALEVLPREIQELIVDRLIQAITAPKEIQDNLEAAKCLEQQTSKPLEPLAVPQSPKENAAPNTNMGSNLPLAAATLAALLSQYGEDAVKAAAKDSSQHKALLIPVHA